MNKLLKLFSVLFIGALSVGFASCSDDDAPAGPSGDALVEQLQGTWTVDLIKVQVMGQIIEMNRDELSQNTGYSDFYDDVLTFNGTKVNGYDYQINGNQILLPWYEEHGWWQTVSFSGNNMTLFLAITYEGIPMNMWATYVKTGSRADDVSGSKASTSILEACMKSM
ncbi:MAG: hypothetical protein ACI3YC_00165 [Alloprevotella sp.]